MEKVGYNIYKISDRKSQALRKDIPFSRGIPYTLGILDN